MLPAGLTGGGNDVMSRRTRRRSAATMSLVVLVATLVASPVPAGGHGPLPPGAASRQLPPVAPLQLSAAIAAAPTADGTVRRATANPIGPVSDVAAGPFAGVSTSIGVTSVAQPGISAPADVIVGEGDGHVDLVVSLSAPGLSPVSVNYATANSTAVGSTLCNYDYVPASGTLNFATSPRAGR